MGREILGLAGDSPFLDKIHHVFKSTDAVLLKKSHAYTDTTGSNV